MIRSQLNSYSGADPIWGFVALIRSERYTGEAAVGIDPRVRLFAVDGRVYFAESEGDAPIGARLVNCGAISTTQLERGAVQIGDTSSLARLFQREPSIDRDAVELTLELATESLLESIAKKPVGMPEVFPLRHHWSGVHHWLRSAAVSAAAAAPIVVEEAVVAQEPVVVAVEEPAIVAEEPALVVEEPAIVAGEPVLVEDMVVVDETPTIEEAPTFEAAPVLVEVPVPEEPVLTPEFVPETVDVESASPSWSAEMVAEPTPEHEAHDNELPALLPLSVLRLPTFSSMTEPPLAQPVVEEAVVDEPVVDEAVVEETVVEETVVEATVVEETVVEETVVEEEADLQEAEPMLAPIPTLASLTLPTLPSASAPRPQPVPASTELVAATTVADLFDSLPEQPAFASASPYQPAEPLAGLPKLALAPISMNDLTAPLVAPNSSFGEPTHNLAAVDIWEMVDVLTDDGLDGEQELVGSGGSDKRGRGWLRGRKS